MSIQSVKRIVEIFVNSQGSIRPHFILSGASGSGKTFLIKQLAHNAGIPFISVSAANLTREGVSGASLSRVLTPLLNSANVPTIVFVDEFDKLFMNEGQEGGSSATQAVQDELLKTIEDSATIAGDYGKFFQISTEKCLFIFAGAFGGRALTDVEDVKSFGVRTEFLGRVGLVYNLPSVSLDKMVRILKNSPLLDQYCHQLQIDFTIAFSAIEQELRDKYDTTTIGVRLIPQLIHQYFIDGFKTKTKPTGHFVE